MNLVHVRNTGVAFSIFSGGGTLVLVFTLVALAVLVAYFARRPDRPWLWLPTGMLVGGAIGNLIDRIANGAVTDFIKLPALAGLQRGGHVDHVRRAGAAVGARRPARQGVGGGVVSAERERGQPVELRVPEQAAGTRLDRFLAAPLGSRARAQA